MQGRNGSADVEDGLVDTVGEGESGTNGESSINMHTLPRVCYHVLQHIESAQCSVMTWRGGMRGWEVHEGGIYA